MEKIQEYNSYLLNENKPTDNKAALLELLKGMSAEERAVLLEETLKQ